MGCLNPRETNDWQITAAMSDADHPFLLPTAVVAEILTAADPSYALPAHLAEPIRLWLSQEREAAVRRSNKVPLTKADVERLERAYRDFSEAIGSLQNRTLPPPLIPTSDGRTAWDDWREIYEQFGYVRGRPESSDWLLIGALLALYETVSGRSPSGAQVNGPTMRFLRPALAALAEQAPDDARSNFEAPTAEALKRQLPRMEKLSLWHAKRRLSKLMQGEGQ
jgi:hypothetical protein